MRDGDVVRGRYQVVRQIGSGAGGKIHLGLDLRLGNRATAIKFYEPDALIQDLSEHVRSGIISRDVYENEVSNIYHRFRQEAVGISRLDHPNIVKVFDYEDQEYSVSGPRGSRKQTRPFLCMEYIEGETLEAAFAQGNVSLERGLRIGGQVADGLAFAHKAGYVHRDLKPSNIMISGAGEDLQVKIIDWGVAKVVEHEVKEATTRLAGSSSGEDIRTRGLLLGTPKFIAPEHFESGGAKWTAASDVFSLGMILFRLVTQRPLRRESYVGECLTQSDRDLLKDSCAGKAEVAELVLSCLSEVRDQRMSAREVKEALNRLSGEEDTQQRQAAPAEPEGEPPVSRADWSDKRIDRSQTVVTDTTEDSNHMSSMVASLQSGPSMAVVMGILVLAILGTVTWLFLESAGGESETPSPESSEVVSSQELRATGEEQSDEAPAALPQKAETEPAWTRTIRIESKPVSRVFERLAGSKAGMRELGETPFDFEFTHPTEARRLLFRPKNSDDRKIYTEMESTIFAADYETETGDEELKHFVKLRCADLTDPGCNDYLERFNRAFEEVE